MRFQISGPTRDTASPVSNSKTRSTFEICSKICGLSTCVEVENTSTVILCGVLSHFPFSDWLPRRSAFSLYVSFAITPVADGVDEWIVSVMMSKRPTSIADFLAFPVRLTVGLAPFSVFRALFISKALLLARRVSVTNSVYFLLSMACCVVCRLFVYFAQLFAE